MSALSSLQSDFQDYLLNGGDRMRERVTGTSRVSANTRLAIYHDAYRLRLLEALDSNYPVLHAWLGDRAFEQLGLIYLRSNPSTHFSIRYFGHRLPQFLTGDEYHERPYLAELAAFEWAISEAFDAEDGPILRIEDMGSVPAESWPGMRLRFHASVHRLDLRWNAPVMWKAGRESLDADKKTDACRSEASNTPATETAFPGHSQHSVDIPPPQSGNHPQAWVVWRQDLKNYFRSLPVEEAWAIDALREGVTFAEVCEGLCEWIDPPHVAPHAAGLVKQWITDGMIRGIESGEQ